MERTVKVIASDFAICEVKMSNTEWWLKGLINEYNIH